MREIRTQLSQASASASMSSCLAAWGTACVQCAQDAMWMVLRHLAKISSEAMLGQWAVPLVYVRLLVAPSSFRSTAPHITTDMCISPALVNIKLLKRSASSSKPIC